MMSVHKRHLIFEPFSAGLGSHILYPNGISCTLPEDVQVDLIHTLPGLEKAKVIYPGMDIGWRAGVS